MMAKRWYVIFGANNEKILLEPGQLMLQLEEE